MSEQGLDLSSISYDQDGNIVIKEKEENDTTQELNTLERYEKEELDKPQDILEDVKPIPQQEFISNELNVINNPEFQTIEEMDADIKRSERKFRAEKRHLDLTNGNIRFLSGIIFTLFGLSLGTFVFKDYITFTLGGIVVGLLVGQVLCEKNDKLSSNSEPDSDTPSKDENTKDEI